MIRDVSPWIAAALGAAMFGALVASGTSWTPFVLTFIVATLVFGAIGLKMRTEEDEAWLPRWIMLGFAAKIAGTLARYWMVVVLYGGGDSYGYFDVGNQLADIWHAGRIPELTESGGFGTQILEYITGILFAIFSPDMVGGFLIFGLLAFGGQLFFYAAFRQWASPHQLKPYAFFILFLPTYVFWPSSIGKDAVVVFALGASAYCAARLLKSYDIRWIVGLAAPLGLLGLIRIHVAGLVVIGLMAAGLLSRMPEEAGAAVRFRRVLTLGGFLAAGALVLTVFPDIFGVDLSGGDALDSFTSDVTRRTSESGTVASGGPVSGPADIPGAIALALFRPFAFEASEFQHLFSAAETSLLLALTLWKLPAILRSWRSWRGNAYVVFCTFYVLSYSIAFSVVRNMGIIARQRGQVIAFFLCIVIAMGWTERPKAVRSITYPTGVVEHRDSPQSRARVPGP